MPGQTLVVVWSVIFFIGIGLLLVLVLLGWILFGND